MLWNIQAAENLISGDFVEFIKDQDGKLSCKKALALASISAIAARDIGEGEILSFDKNGDTKDLTTPQKQSSAGETGHFEGRNFDSLFWRCRSRSSAVYGSRIVNKKNSH